jgi:hypothetical protein
MKKEVILAVILGLGLGLVVTYGIYTARKSLKGPSSKVVEVSPSPTADNANSALVIISPEDESLQFTKDLKVTGTTTPTATVVVFINDTFQVTKADNSGNFSIQSQLNNISNIIVIRAIDSQGKVTEENRTVVYSSVPLEQIPTATFSATPSPSPKAAKKPASTNATSSGVTR